MKPLTPRENEIVELTALWASQKEIAAHLGISINTVDTTIRHAKERIGCQKEQ